MVTVVVYGPDAAAVAVEVARRRAAGDRAAGCIGGADRALEMGGDLFGSVDEVVAVSHNP